MKQNNGSREETIMAGKEIFSAITGLISAVLLIWLVTMCGCSRNVNVPLQKAAPEEKPVEDRTPVVQGIEAGDLVFIDYAMKIADTKELVFTTSKETAESKNQLKASWYHQPEDFDPEQIIAGDGTSLVVIARSIIGMQPGEHKTLTMPAEKSFGNVDPEKIVKMPTVKTVPREARVAPREYVAKFNSFPVKGKRVAWAPYFLSEITEVNEDYVVLKAMLKKGKTVEQAFGKTRIERKKNEILLTLEPRIGAPFFLNNRSGRIIDSSEKEFTVDFNHPGAGKEILLDIDIVSVEKAVTFKGNTLTWIEDHDAGYETAKKEKKPMVLVLYADWCGYSKKMLENTLIDPRVLKFRDHFVWTKVDSDKDQSVKELYGQEGFPMIVITDSEGNIEKKIDGYKDADAFRKELKAMMKKIGGQET